MSRNRLLLVSAVLGLSPYAFCHCSPASERTTSWGVQNVLIAEPEPFNNVRGLVTDINRHALPNTLIEVFDQPEIVRKDASPSRSGQKRLAACLTGQDGKFEFDLPQGEYEVRLSKPAEWNVTSVLVKVERSARKRKIRIRLTIAQ